MFFKVILESIFLNGKKIFYYFGDIEGYSLIFLFNLEVGFLKIILIFFLECFVFKDVFSYM